MKKLFFPVALFIAWSWSVITSSPAGQPEPANEDAETIVVTNRIYHGYRSSLKPETFVYLEADFFAGSPIRATQRSLGYREVDYKAVLPRTLFFKGVSPATNGTTIIYDYSAQAAKTNLVGFWVDKNVPVIVGPDGNAYVTDGHHTIAGYVAAPDPLPQILPGRKRVILGHIAANYFDPLKPRTPDDAWWIARASENNAYLYGVNGNALALPHDPGYANLQPISPALLPMPLRPSSSGAGAMQSSPGRSLTWGLADGIVKSAIDRAGAKITGYKKTAPGGNVDINFVEFYWADFLRNQIVWDDAGTPSPGSRGRSANVTAPLSFFAAVANGIALANSELYRDQFGRTLRNYTNSLLFAPNTVNWANGSLSNGLAAAGSTFHLYLRDDSTISGDIVPSAKSTNILHVDTFAGLTLNNSASNVTRLLINAGGQLATSWKESTVPNSVLTFPAGTGTVTIAGTAFVAEETVVSNGVLYVQGALLNRGGVTVARGALRGSGTISGPVNVRSGATLSPSSLLTIHGPLALSGVTSMQIKKSGASLTADQIIGLKKVDYGGILTVRASGDPLARGDTFKLFSADAYSGSFASFDLPLLGPDLTWNTSRISSDGSIRVEAALRLDQ